MFRKMYIIPADRLHGSPPMKLKYQEQVNICKHQEQVKKRKHHPSEEQVKIRQNMDEADFRKRRIF